MVYKSNVTIEKEKKNNWVELGSLDEGTYFLTSTDSLALVIVKGKERIYTDTVYMEDGKILAMKNDTKVRVVDVDIKIRLK